MKIRIRNKQMSPKTAFVLGLWAFASCCAASPNVDSDGTLIALVGALVISASYA